MQDLITGLSSSEAQRIRAEVGPNATPDVAIHPVRLVLSKFLAPVSVLLEIAIVLHRSANMSRDRSSEHFSYSIPRSASFTRAGLRQRSRP